MIHSSLGLLYVRNRKLGVVMTNLSYSLEASVGEGEHVEHTVSKDDPGHGKDPKAVQTSDGSR